MSLPRAAAIVPNRNHAALLPRCLDALLRQSSPFAEIIVVDDASTDRSVEVAEEYARKHPTIRVLRNEKNLGVSRTLNRGMELAASEYVGFFASDDEALPWLLEKTLPWLEKHPQAGLATGLCEWRFHAKQTIWREGIRMPREACYLSPADLVQLGLEGRLSIAAQPSIYNKEALLRAGGWIPELHSFTDCFGTWVVGFRHGICHIPETLSVFNLYANSYYHSPEAVRKRREAMTRFLDLLEEDRYADAGEAIRASGILGTFGPELLRVLLRRKGAARYINRGFIRRVGRRSAELVGRRFPRPLARLCLRLFYKSPQAG
jgi:glycosyltransferase involved in cell wall biosynthesis